MPYLDLVAADDYASIWYTTNTSHHQVSSFNPEKPTVVLLHPPFLDSSWLENQFDDPRLSGNYNLIAFDLRNAGKSHSRPNGKHDLWVEAADLAFAHQLLHLPASHCFAVGNISAPIALRFAALFPEMCASLTLVAVPPQTELKYVFDTLDEMQRAWCYAEDLDSFEHAANEAVSFTAGSNSDPDLQDDLIAYWEVNYPPFRRARMIQIVNNIVNRTPLKPHVLASITQPVLIIQAERSEAHPLKYAEVLRDELINAKDGALVYVVKGGVGYMTIVPSFASIINQTFSKFLSRHPRPRSDLRPSDVSLEERMKKALAKLGEFEGDASIGQRDPKSSMSFSCATPEVAKNQMNTIMFYSKDQGKAYSPLGPHGRPMRKYSEKKQEHWFHGERDGLSYAGAAAHTLERQDPLRAVESRINSLLALQSQSEPISSEIAQDGRLRRSTFTPQSFSVDKHVVKGSMSKVVQSTGVPLPRLMHML